MLKSHFPVPPLVKFQMEMPHLDGKSNSSVAVQKPTNEYQRKAFSAFSFKAKEARKFANFPRKSNKIPFVICCIMKTQTENESVSVCDD